MDLADQYPVFYLLGPWRVLVAQSRFGTGGAKLFGGCSPGFHGKGLPGAILRGWCWSVWSQFFWDVDHDFSGTEAFIKFEDSICVSWKQWLCKFWISIYHFKCFLWNAVFYIFTCFLRSISSHILELMSFDFLRGHARLSIRNCNYTSDAVRSQLMKLIVWSFIALRIFSGLYGSFETL